jgi:hypothetical protein
MTATPTKSEAAIAPSSSEEFTIDQCGSCGSRIALRSPNSACPASVWICRRCGSVFFARCQERDGQPFSAGTRLVSYGEFMRAVHVQTEGRSAGIAAKDVKRLVQCLTARTYSGPEARRQKRFPVAAPVTVLPLGPDLRITGPASRIMTVNISSGGAALVFPRHVAERYLAMDFSASGVDLLPAILHIKRTRRLAMAFEIAGEFLSRILH